MGDARTRASCSAARRCYWCMAIASSELGQLRSTNDVLRGCCNAEDARHMPTTALSMGNKLRGQKGWNSLNQLISPCDEERRHFEANRFCGLEIDHQLELRRLLHREVGGLGALQDLVHKHGAAPEEIEKARPVRHETPGLNTLPDAVCCREAAPGCEVCEPCCVGVEHRIWQYEEGSHALFGHRRECAVE